MILDVIAQFSTVAVLNDVATLVERVSYDAYGNARHHRMADLTGDGGVGGGDSGLLQANWNDYGVGDLNRDGFVNAADLGMLNADWDPAEPSGTISTTDNIVGYAGYIFNAEVPGSDGRSGLYTVRHRHYSPDLGRWLSRDPLGYLDGMSLYAYVAGGALTFNDPFGLTSVGACSGINSDVNYVRRWIENRRHGLNDCSDELSTTSDVGINPFKYGVGRHGALFGSKGTLDYEAERKAGQCGRFCEDGESKTIRVMMVAPKTNTTPCDAFSDPNPGAHENGNYHEHGCCTIDIEVVWPSNDRVPNQALFRPDNKSFWRKFGHVHKVRIGGVCWLNPLDISGHFFHNIADPSKATSADGAPFQLYGAWYRMGQEESDYLFTNPSIIYLTFHSCDV